jgi:CRISPR-associated protein Csy3
MATQTELKTASVLAFERKLDPSDAIFRAGTWADKANTEKWPAIVNNEKSVRGTISNRLKSTELDATKLNAKVENPNLQTVDTAALPHNCDTLAVTFSLRALPGMGVPSACNNSDYQAKLAQVVGQYTTAHAAKELARRYAMNLANGRFLWRNRLGAESAEVVVNQKVNGKAIKTWRFNAMDFSLRNFDLPKSAETEVAELAAAIAAGLTGKAFALFEITGYARIGNGQEVYPSQELILDKAESKKSKTLYTVGTRDTPNAFAGMHSQKIGNAIRTIDDWHAKAATVGPIPVEPYGSVTTLGEAFRQPKGTQKDDFYTLLDNWVLKDKAPDANQQHFVIANLIRGGVFGESEKAQA